jgi:phospholipid/cholesterol/gamma-HCH transport system permease protein
VARPSDSIHQFLQETGHIARFTSRLFRESTRQNQEFGEFLRQCYWVGYKSLPLVTITAFIMGLVLTIQSRPTLVEFGAESLLPSMVAVSLVREISPVITALICAGKIGSGMGAELGSMRVTEQIDAMEVSGTNPFKYLVVTRVFATMLMLPILANLSNAISLYGTYLGVNIRGAVSWDLFWTQGAAHQVRGQRHVGIRQGRGVGSRLADVRQRRRGDGAAALVNAAQPVDVGGYRHARAPRQCTTPRNRRCSRP